MTESVRGFRAAHGEGGDWRAVANACIAALGNEIGEDGLGVLYVTDHHAGKMAEIVDHLRARTGIAAWVGTTGIGIVAHGGAAAAPPVEYYDRPAMALLVADLAPDAFRLFEPLQGGLGPFRREHGAWLAAAHPQVALVHADPRNPHVAAIVSDLASETGCFLVGGLTSSRAGCPQAAGRVSEGGVSGVLFAGEVALVTGLSQGCAPLGPAHTITAGDGSLVLTLDDKPALELLTAEGAAILEGDWRRIPGRLFVALPVPGSDRADYLVRHVTGIDPDHGCIAIDAAVGPGDRLMFARRDRAAAEQDLKRMLEDVARRSPRGIKAGVYVSCLARGPNLFGPESEELRLIRDRLGDFPLVGFFANGEICHDRLYGYTGVLALFV